MGKRRIGEILLEFGLVSESDIETALSSQAGTGKLLGEILVEMGLVQKRDLWLAWQSQVAHNPEVIYGIAVHERVSELALGDLAAVYRVVPLFEGKGKDALTVVMMRPQDVTVIDDMRVFLDYDVTSVVASSGAVVEAMRKYHSDIPLRHCDDCGKVLENPDTMVHFDSKVRQLTILCSSCFPKHEEKLRQP